MGFQAALREFEQRSSKLLDESPQMDEQNTKRKIIEPLIDLLGWDILSSDVELEYSVTMGSGTKKVDYALLLDEAPVVFIEAKGADTTITDSHVDQLRSYMRQIGVDWGLITNGRTFQIFRRDRSSSKPNEISLASFSLEEITQYIRPLRALARDSIDTGEAQQIADQIEAVNRSVARLRENKEAIAEEVTKVVTKRVDESVSQRVEDEAKNFIDDLILSLTDQTHQATRPKAGDRVEATSTGDYSIRVLQDGSEVREISGETQSEAMGNLVNYLIKEHGLLDHIELPYVPGTGSGTRALVNSEPVHTNGTEMRQYVELDDGYYLFTSLNAPDKIRYISELPDRVGLTCEFSENWT